jgi:hypothetical protein
VKKREVKRCSCSRQVRAVLKLAPKIMEILQPMDKEEKKDIALFKLAIARLEKAVKP